MNDTITRAMDLLAEYTGRDARMIQLDARLQDGGRLTHEDAAYIIALLRWRNMDKGN